MSYATEALAITGKSLIITLAVGATTVGAVGIIVPEWQAMVEGPESHPDKGAACKRAKQLYLAVTGAEDSKAVRCVGSSVQDANTGPKECKKKGATQSGYKMTIDYNTCTQKFNGCLNWENANKADDGCDSGAYMTVSSFNNMSEEHRKQYIKDYK